MTYHEAMDLLLEDDAMIVETTRIGGETWVQATYLKTGHKSERLRSICGPRITEAAAICDLAWRVAGLR